MADKRLTTSVVANFGDDDTERVFLVWEIDGEKESEDLDEVYVRLYYFEFPDFVKAMDGSLASKGTQQDKVTHFIYFEGTRFASLEYPYVVNEAVSVSTQGTFYNTKGESIAPTFSYDASRNAVVMDENGFGIAKASYTTRYRSYLFTHSYDAAKKKYRPSLLVAIDTENNGYASLRLSAPIDQDQQEGTEEDTDPEDVDEEESDLLYKTRVKNNSKNTIDPVIEVARRGYFGSKGRLVYVKVNPADSYTVSTVGAGRLFAGYERTQTAKMVEYIEFNNSTTANLHYFPNGAALSMSIDSTDFYDMYGKELVGTRIMEPGDVVKEGNWTGPSTYTISGQRKLGPTEIGIVSLSGVLKPCYGMIKAEYEYDFREYRFFHNEKYDPSWRKDGYYWQPMILAFRARSFEGVIAGMIKVDPPNFKAR